jgi:hypothetical protein
MATTSSLQVEPHRETARVAWVNGTSSGCTRFGVSMQTAPASGVGTEGT